VKAPIHRSAAFRFAFLACIACGVGALLPADGPAWRLLGGAVVFAGVLLAARVSLLGPLARFDEALARIRASKGIARLPDAEVAELEGIADTINELLSEVTASQAEAIERQRELLRMQERLAQQPMREREARQVEEANRRLAARLRELSLIFDITRSLNSTLEVDALLHRLTELVATTMGFDGFAVLLAEPSGELRVRACYGELPGGRREGETLAPGEGAAGEAAATAETVLQRRASVGGTEGSLLAVPMQHKEQVVGVLVFFRGRIDGFLPDEMKLVSSIAGQAALAMANARLYEKTVALSLTDPLTGVFNRRHLFAHLEMELRRAERYGDPVTVAMIDIDHFKQLNDTFGHATGDAVLQAVAGALRRSVRRVDTVARFGGEEFCVILPRLARSEALEVAEKLRLAIHELVAPAPAGKAPVRIGASLGVATFPGDAADAVGLLDAADSALYASKRAGRNRSTAYAPGMELHPERQRQITAAEAEDLLPEVRTATGS